MTSGHITFWQLTTSWRLWVLRGAAALLFVQKREDVDLEASSHSCNKMSVLEG